MPDLRIHGVVVPGSAIRFRTSRSSGPGGQNVNKLDTRVDVLLDLAAIPGLTAEQRTLLEHRLASRIDRTGVLHVSSQRHRSQWQNKQQAIERLVELLDAALTIQRSRTSTKPTAASLRRRVETKRRRSQTKSMRRRPLQDE